MWKWLRALLGAKPREEEGADDRTLALQGEIQGLRLELGERERAVASLRTELERQRKAEGGRVGEAVESQKERLMRDLGPPAAQVVTQAHLLEVDGRPVQARDVLALAKRLVRVLEDHGMTLEGKVGEAVPMTPIGTSFWAARRRRP